jgi:hypothetical protein
LQIDYVCTILRFINSLAALETAAETEKSSNRRRITFETHLFPSTLLVIVSVFAWLYTAQSPRLCSVRGRAWSSYARCSQRLTLMLKRVFPFHGFGKVKKGR